MYLYLKCNYIRNVIIVMYLYLKCNFYNDFFLSHRETNISVIHSFHGFNFNKDICQKKYKVVSDAIEYISCSNLCFLSIKLSLMQQSISPAKICVF